MVALTLCQRSEGVVIKVKAIVGKFLFDQV